MFRNMGDDVSSDVLEVVFTAKKQEGRNDLKRSFVIVETVIPKNSLGSEIQSRINGESRTGARKRSATSERRPLLRRRPK